MYYGPIDPMTYKRIIPWKPRDLGLILFDVKSKKIIETIPFMGLNVYANGNKQYVVWDDQNKTWLFPHEDNSTGSHSFYSDELIPDWVPKEVLVMAMLVKG